MSRAAGFGIVVLLWMSPAALAADDGEVLFADNFATLDPGWGAVDQQFLGVENGKLALIPASGRYRSLPYQGKTFGDVDVRVKLAQASGEIPGSAGISFWGNSDSGEAYFARMQSNGYFTVEQRLPNGRLLAPVLLKPNDAIDEGLGKLNELRVVTRGKSATVYINGRPAASVEGTPPEHGSLVGVMARSPAVRCRWEFSDFVVREPQ